MICGIYHSVSEEYVQRYIDEEAFRWNTRQQDEAERFEYMFKAAMCNFTYQDVVVMSSLMKMAA